MWTSRLQSQAKTGQNQSHASINQWPDLCKVNSRNFNVKSDVAQHCNITELIKLKQCFASLW